MDYKETQISKELKKANDLIYNETKRAFKDAAHRAIIIRGLEALNKAADELAMIRKAEIEEERQEVLDLNVGLQVTKGMFIDTQRNYELSDEETERYLVMLYLQKEENSG